MQLVWAQNILEKTNNPVLVLTPLAVSYQTEREATKFGIQAKVSRDGTVHPITIANYEMLEHFNASDFSGVVCDESGCLKNYAGARRKYITQFMRKMKYRLLCSATPAPNDYNELGTSSEVLGQLGYMDMLAKFFVNDMNNCAARYRNQTLKYRLKGHAEIPFWSWVCSWARALRTPSDMGFDDSRFILPALTTIEHLVTPSSPQPGRLFSIPSVGLFEQRQERKRTVDERCARMAELVNHTGKPALIWCHLNDEGDTLEKMIPDAIQVAGKDADNVKEDRLWAFAKGESRVLITKPKIGAWGLNFQHCSHIGYFPDHSYEQYYQGIRRCWRFGQLQPVTVDIVTTVGEQEILKNLQRKAEQADSMFTMMVYLMNNALEINAARVFDTPELLPDWLKELQS
jgi:hypothetical protein